LRYSHVTAWGNKGDFVLDGRTGQASYTFNGKPHSDELVFTRNATLYGADGWAYQVKRDGRMIPLWFFFGSKPFMVRDGRSLYYMAYSQQPDNEYQKKNWVRILTPAGTVASSLDEKTFPAAAR
jgi:hypothetical protein